MHVVGRDDHRGTHARLAGIRAQQKLFGQIDYVLLTGEAGGVKVSERVVPG